MAVADASIIANAASGVLFVVGAGVTTRSVAQVALQRLGAAHAAVIGVVLNKASLERAGYAPHYQRQDEEYYEHPSAEPGRA
jgi:Mrp family chromosome partitioning ATPase